MPQLDRLSWTMLDHGPNDIHPRLLGPQDQLSDLRLTCGPRARLTPAIDLARGKQLECLAIQITRGTSIAFIDVVPAPLVLFCAVIISVNVLG